MPLYEFTCSECGHSFTVLTSWQKKKESNCPRCGSPHLKETWGGFTSPGCGKSTPGFT